MASSLDVAPSLDLPADYVTQSAAILAVKRAGKSNAAVVIAEKMFAAGLPFVVIDPKGDWWGMRSNADGTGPGLPIPVLGGLHGDMPLTPESGRLIAEIIVTENLTGISRADCGGFTVTAAKPSRAKRVPQRIKLVGGGFVPEFPDECEPHTPDPSGYLQWHAWAERMAKTHKQRQCKGCGLWAIWEPKAGDRSTETTLPVTGG